MPEAIIKYSDLIEDDGGFEKTQNDLKKLGDALIAEAKRIKGEIRLVDPKNVDQISEYADAIEVLKKTYNTHKSTLEVVHRAEEQRKKTQQEAIKLQNLQDKSLTELEAQYKKIRFELKKVNKLEKVGAITTKDATEKQAKLNVELKSVRSARNKLQKEIVDGIKVSKKEQKLQEAMITIEKERTDTLSEIRERMSALRLVVQNTNLTTEEGRQKVADYNKEINELTDVLSENSDKFVQNKINIGNYKDSVVEALKSSEVFTGELAFLNEGLNKIVSWFYSSEKATEADTKAKQANTKATVAMRKALKTLNRTAKAGGVLLLLTALAALAGLFGDTRAGVIRTEKAMTAFNSTLTTVKQVAISVFTGIGSAFGALFQVFQQNSLSEIIMGDVNVFEGFAKKIKESFADIKKQLGDGKKGIEKGFENIDKAWKLEDQVRRTNQELEKLNGQLALAQATADDSTKSLATQLRANTVALQLSEEIMFRRNKLAKDELEIANEKVKQNILANGQEVKNLDMSKTGVEFAQEVLDLAQKRGKLLEISNDLLDTQQEAVIGVISAENELEITRVNNARQRREIERDIFEQNLDLLIDLIDTEKNLSEQYVNDVTKNFKSRVTEFNNFVKRFRQNAQAQLNEFTKLAEQTGRDLLFDIEYGEDGTFDVLINGSRITIDNIVELNKELQSLGLAEIPINRFREFVVEGQNAVRDFKELDKTLGAAALKVKELRGVQTIDREELEAIRQLNKEFNSLNSVNIDFLTPNQKEQYIKQLEEFEERKAKIQEDAERRRLNNRLESIDRELQKVEEGSEAEIELTNERIGIEKELADRDFGINADKLKDNLDAAKDKWKEFADELRSILTEVFRQVEQSQQKALSNAERALDKQEDAVSNQRKRAEQGFENTLAFEQKELAKREKQKQEEQKKLERIQKLEAYWNTYNANLSSLKENEDSSTAIVKTLRDIAVIEGITASVASFGDGGLVADKVPTDGRGITRGRSHRGQNGGIPVLVEGNEGFFSGNEVNNMGRDNFYALKELAGRGPLDSNFFTQQKKDFLSSNPVFPSNKNVERELKEVKKAINNKPVSSFDVIGLSNGILEVVETTESNNKKVRNHYKIKKRKL